MADVEGFGVSIHFETWGDPEDSTVLMICGLGGQLIDWPPLMLHALAIAGHHVVTFDNRDAGLSTHLLGKANVGAIRAGLDAGTRVDVPYLLTDMAADVIAVLNRIGVSDAHIIGRSMGGMIGQTVAIEHPTRVRSLTSIMSTTGAADVGQPSPTGEKALYRPPPPDRDGAIRVAVESARLLATPGSFDRDGEAALAGWRYDRAFDPAGTGRQVAALMASGDRTERLRSVPAPTLVIHGDGDQLIDVSGGRATARAIPHATYVEIQGMGHDLPARHLADILRPIASHVRRADLRTSP